MIVEFSNSHAAFLSQVSGIFFEFDPDKEPYKRVDQSSVRIGGMHTAFYSIQCTLVCLAWGGGECR